MLYLVEHLYSLEVVTSRHSSIWFNRTTKSSNVDCIVLHPFLTSKRAVAVVAKFNYRPKYIETSLRIGFSIWFSNCRTKMLKSILELGASRFTFILLNSKNPVFWLTFSALWLEKQTRCDLQKCGSIRYFNCIFLSLHLGQNPKQHIPYKNTFFKPKCLWCFW